MNDSVETTGTAYHEAAHAVSLDHYGVPVQRVTVSQKNAGVTNFSRAEFEALDEKKASIVILAGMYGESRVRTDRTVVEFISIALGATSDRDLLHERFAAYWSSTSSIAHQVAHGAAENFVGKHWAEIERVANALLKQSGFPKTLNEAEFRAALKI